MEERLDQVVNAVNDLMDVTNSNARLGMQGSRGGEEDIIFFIVQGKPRMIVFRGMTHECTAFVKGLRCALRITATDGEIADIYVSDGTLLDIKLEEV